MIIGKFTLREGSYLGVIAMLGIQEAARIEPARLSGTGVPDYTVLSDDGMVELGAAWKRHSGKTGKAYLSVRLDSPVLAAPINCALVAQDDEPDEFALVWKRRRRGDDATTE